MPSPARAHKTSNGQRNSQEQRSTRSRTQSGPLQSGPQRKPSLGTRKMSQSEVPPLPVKRPRRSVVPEYNSDSENQPESSKSKLASPFSEEKIARILRSTRRSCAALDAAEKESAPQPKPAVNRRSSAKPLASASNRSDAANEKRVLRSNNHPDESPADAEPTTKVSPRVSTRSSRSSIVMPPQPLVQPRGQNAKVTTATRSPTGRLRTKSTAELTSSGMKRKRRSDLAPAPPRMLRGQGQQKTPSKVATATSPPSAVKKARVLRSK